MGKDSRPRQPQGTILSFFSASSAAAKTTKNSKSSTVTPTNQALVGKEGPKHAREATNSDSARDADPEIASRRPLKRLRRRIVEDDDAASEDDAVKIVDDESEADGDSANETGQTETQTDVAKQQGSAPETVIIDGEESARKKRRADEVARNGPGCEVISVEESPTALASSDQTSSQPDEDVQVVERNDDSSASDEGSEEDDGDRDDDNSDNDDGDDGDDDDENNAAPTPKSKQTKIAGKRSKADAGTKSSSYLQNLTEKPTWKSGAPIPYRFLADTFAKVEAITGRLEIQAILTSLLRTVMETTPEDLVAVVYLCINKLAPAHDGIEIGVGEGILMRALSQATGSTMVTLRAQYKKVGDLGDVACGARATQKTMFAPPPLTVRKVFSELRAIAATSGKAAQEAKRGRIVKLLVAATTKNEARYIVRALLGKLRIHLADKTVIVALASAVVLEKLGVGTGTLLSVDGKKKTKLSSTEEELQEQLKQAANRLSSVYNQMPVWDVVLPALLEAKDVNDSFAEKCSFQPGIPVAPMLAKPTKAIGEVLERFSESEFTCEFKYDGERAQIHRRQDGTVKIYSRNAENLTEKYPDLVRALPLSLKEEFKDASFVLDAESVAYDLQKKKILPFQELQGRKRKDVDEASVQVRVCVFAFDLLYFDGDSMLLEPLKARRERMLSVFNPMEGVFMFAEGHDSRDPEEIMELLNKSIKAGCEGLMVKALDGVNGTYEPANRSQNWLKVKKDYLDGLGDTLDLVPVGGYIGRGKRTGTYGGFLLACYDPENEEYQTICKVGTGFSEADLETFSKFYNDESEERKLEQPKSYYRYTGNRTIAPDVWFEPSQVWEVKCADLSISPAHSAAIGQVDDTKGIALRFPRFLRVRDDKSPDEATTAEQVADLYRQQSSVANND